WDFPYEQRLPFSQRIALDPAYPPLPAYVAGVTVCAVMLGLALAVGVGLLGWIVRLWGMRHVAAWFTGRSDAAPEGPTAAAEEEREDDSSHPARPPHWPLLLGLLVGAVGLSLALWVLEPSDNWFANALKHLGDWILSLRFWSDAPIVPEQDLYVHGLMTVSIVASTAMYILIYPFRRHFSPAVAFLFLLDVIISAYGFFAFNLPGKWVFILLVLLILSVLGGLPLYKHRFAGLNYHKRVNLTAYFQEVKRVEMHQRSEQHGEFMPLKPHHIQFYSHTGQKVPLAIACVSGGGIRSAAWTMSVLAQIEEQFQKANIPFPYYLWLITGASGGMVGASYYAATLQAPDPARPNVAHRDVPLERMLENIQKDCLTPVIYRMI